MYPAANVCVRQNSGDRQFSRSARFSSRRFIILHRKGKRRAVRESALACLQLVAADPRTITRGKIVNYDKGMPPEWRERLRARVKLTSVVDYYFTLSKARTPLSKFYSFLSGELPFKYFA